MQYLTINTQHTLDSNFTSIIVSVPDTMEGSASQMHCTSRQRRMERCSGKNSREREGEMLEHVVEEVNK